MNVDIEKIKEFGSVNAKALYVLLGAIVLGILSARGADTPAGSGITIDEWLNILLSAMGLGYGTWAITNGKKKTAVDTSGSADSQVSQTGADGRHGL